MAKIYEIQSNKDLSLFEQYLKKEHKIVCSHDLDGKVLSKDAPLYFIIEGIQYKWMYTGDNTSIDVILQSFRNSKLKHERATWK